LLKQLRIDNEFTGGASRTGADIDLLGQLDIGSRKAFGINPFESPGGSLPAGFSALDPWRASPSIAEPSAFFIVPQNSGFDLRQRVNAIWRDAFERRRFLVSKSG
jgi:hypothetical protein